VTLVTASNTSAPIEIRYLGSRRVPPVAVDLEGAQQLSSIPPARLLRLARQGHFEVRKRVGQICITCLSLDRLIDILPTATCQ
jgi:hypothetical protein